MHPVYFDHGLFSRRNTMAFSDVSVVLPIADLLLMRKARSLGLVLLVLQVNFESFLDFHVCLLLLHRLFRGFFVI